MSCATIREKNLRTISGALVLTAFQESFADHSFTSATVISKDSFNLSSSNLTFEVRAAVPTAGGLYGQIMFIPEQDFKNNSINGTIFILMNFRTIKSGFTYDPDTFSVKHFNSMTDLEQFQTYRFHSDPGQNQFINDTIFHWSMNETLYSPSDSLHVNCAYPKCLNILNKGQFRLVLNLAVDNILDSSTQVIRQSSRWKCSSMIVDYVRVLSHQQLENMANIVYNQTEKLASEI